MSIGIIAGKGELPISLAHYARSVGLEPYVAVMEGFGDVLSFRDFSAKVFKIGYVGQILNFFKDSNIKKLVFAGKVDRPKWSDLRIDDMGRMLLFRILKNEVLGDDSLMNIIANFVQEKGFAIVAPADFLHSCEISITTNSIPSQEDMGDIELGIKAAKLLGQVDVGQAVVVERGCVLGVEGQEGTDALIQRCQSLKKYDNPSGILIKALKPIQSSKLDPPVVGPDTIVKLAQGGFRGVALERGAVIIIEPDRVLSLANQFELFVYQYNSCL